MPEDPMVALEAQFEATRRFVDDWLIQLRDYGAELDEQLLVPGSANLRPEDWAPCQVDIELSPGFKAQEGACVGMLVSKRADSSCVTRSERANLCPDGPSPGSQQRSPLASTTRNLHSLSWYLSVQQAAVACGSLPAQVTACCCLWLPPGADVLCAAGPGGCRA